MCILCMANESADREEVQHPTATPLLTPRRPKSSFWTSGRWKARTPGCAQWKNQTVCPPPLWVVLRDQQVQEQLLSLTPTPWCLNTFPTTPHLPSVTELYPFPLRPQTLAAHTPSSDRTSADWTSALWLSLPHYCTHPCLFYICSHMPIHIYTSKYVVYYLYLSFLVRW